MLTSHFWSFSDEGQSIFLQAFSIFCFPDVILQIMSSVPRLLVVATIRILKISSLYQNYNYQKSLRTNWNPRRRSIQLNLAMFLMLYSDYSIRRHLKKNYSFGELCFLSLKAYLDHTLSNIYRKYPTYISDKYCTLSQTKNHMQNKSDISVLCIGQNRKKTVRCVEKKNCTLCEPPKAWFTKCTVFFFKWHPIYIGQIKV